MAGEFHFLHSYMDILIDQFKGALLIAYNDRHM